MSCSADITPERAKEPDTNGLPSVWERVSQNMHFEVSQNPNLYVPQTAGSRPRFVMVREGLA